MTEPVTILAHGDEQAELYSDGEHVAYTVGAADTPVCSKHGRLDDETKEQCDHTGAVDDSGQPTVTVFDVDDLPAELLASETNTKSDGSVEAE